MNGEERGGDVTDGVHALIADLLPVLIPSAELDTAAGTLTLPIGPGRPRASTEAIVRQCSGQPPHTWPRLVDEWLRQVHTDAVTAIGEIEMLGDVRTLLRLRVVPKLPDRERADLVAMEFGSYFDAVVAIEHPTYGGTLTRTRAARLGLSGIGRLATANTHEHELAHFHTHAQQVTITESVLVVSRPGSAYVSTALTELHRYLPADCPFGAIIGVPRYSTMLLYPIVSDAVAVFLPTFARLVTDMHAGADDPCASATYWWRDGGLHEVGVTASADPEHPNVVMPPPMQHVLRHLPPRGHE